MHLEMFDQDLQPPEHNLYCLCPLDGEAEYRSPILEEFFCQFSQAIESLVFVDSLSIAHLY